MRRLIESPVSAVVLALLLLALLTPVATAATITVTSTADTSAADGLCSLREAIIAANTDNAVDGCAAGNGEDVIAFGASLPSPAVFVLTEAGSGEDGAITGDLDVTGALTIIGAGAGNTILDGNQADRLIEVRPGARLMISDVTLRNGNPGPAEGGGILVDATAALTLTRSAVTLNSAAAGGGIASYGRFAAEDSTIRGNLGGGLRSDGGSTKLTQVDVVNNMGAAGISNENQAVLEVDGGAVSDNQGGGIYNAVSRAVLNNVAIIGNTGSGLLNTGQSLSPVTLLHSTVMSNTAASGAGVNNIGIGATAEIRDTNIQGNVASGAGGGVYNSGTMTIHESLIALNRARSGGGIDHSGYTLDLTNVTLSGNTAQDNGGGLYSRASTTLKSVTFTGNVTASPQTGSSIFNDGASLAIGNTIVANPGAADNCFNSEGVIVSLGHNIDSGNSCGLAGAGDQVNTDPRLGPLQDNGGPTATHALLQDSPAIDHGDNVLCPATDQRGVSRPQGANCDIGAFEQASVPNLRYHYYLCWISD